MIFRRIKAHIAKEDWFAVFIDFVIVVFGVFMGFQVQEWNSNRNDRADAQEYLLRLTTDMELSAERNDYQVISNRQHIEHYDVALAALDSCQLRQADEVKFVSALYNLGKTDMPIMIMGTIDELNATGSFPLIGDLELRRMITESIRSQQTVLAIDGQITARIVPSVNYVRTRVRFNQDKHYINADLIDPAEVDFDFEELCADRDFIHAVATVREMTLANIAFNEERRDDQLKIKEALEKRLGVADPDEEK